MSCLVISTASVTGAKGGVVLRGLLARARPLELLPPLMHSCPYTETLNPPSTTHLRPTHNRMVRSASSSSSSSDGDSSDGAFPPPKHKSHPTKAHSAQSSKKHKRVHSRSAPSSSSSSTSAKSGSDADEGGKGRPSKPSRLKEMKRKKHGKGQKHHSSSASESGTNTNESGSDGDSSGSDSESGKRRKKSAKKGKHHQESPWYRRKKILGVSLMSAGVVQDAHRATRTGRPINVLDVLGLRDVDFDHFDPDCRLDRSDVRRVGGLLAGEGTAVSTRLDAEGNSDRD